MRFRHNFNPESQPRDDFHSIFEWCKEKFGQPGWAHSSWTYKHGTWHFRRREDYLIFVLTWL